MQEEVLSDLKGIFPLVNLVKEVQIVRLHPSSFITEKTAVLVVNRKEKANDLPADVASGLLRGYHLRLPRQVHGDAGAGSAARQSFVR